MTTLAIDTSTRQSAVALYANGAVRGELAWVSEQGHTRELLPAIEALLRHVHASLDDVDGLAVALGPGGFTALRVGLSAAKGLAFARDLPLVGVGTLEVAAYPFGATGLPIWAMVDAGRGEIAVARFRRRSGMPEWQREEPEHLTTLDALCARVEEPSLFCGEMTPTMEAVLRGRLGELALVPPPAARRRSAGVLAELGAARLARGERDNVDALQPLYLRRPSVTVPRKP